MALFAGMHVAELHVVHSLQKQTDTEDCFMVNKPEAWLIIDRPRALWVLSGKIGRRYGLYLVSEPKV